MLYALESRSVKRTVLFVLSSNIIIVDYARFFAELNFHNDISDRAQLLIKEEFFVKALCNNRGHY